MIVAYQDNWLNTVHVPFRFSTNEGETWTDFQFSDRKVYVYQLLTEPGEKSTIFTIFGSYADQRHSWLILQVNTSDVLGRLRESCYVPQLLATTKKSHQLFLSVYLSCSTHQMVSF